MATLQVLLHSIPLQDIFITREIIPAILSIPGGEAYDVCTTRTRVDGIRDVHREL